MSSKEYVKWYEKNRRKRPPLYDVWRGIKKRCLKPNDIHYKDYGGRGISVCERWLKYDNFISDMYVSYLKHCENHGNNTSIDRINVNGDYCKENCRWATGKVQSNNKRNNRLLTYGGVTKTMTEWSEVMNLKITTLHMRKSRGWNDEDTLSMPLQIQQKTASL